MKFWKSKVRSPRKQTENILKLKHHRSLGVILDLENDQVLINRKNDGNIDILPMIITSTDFYKTKYIWERLGK
ncbi:CGH_1_HP_G0103920.mRNA.1.CDS.1 [Saccharomyces cerevisiae]|nr:CGH_1_HP_G0103920.mRNA.1.CDS.1 [Saccharomyces cerevisiae]CAI6951117.1 CGH_1_HP_G0103920.mRNA.1.CDS.1 [Saccharomyces cerevisiae]